VPEWLGRIWGPGTLCCRAPLKPSTWVRGGRVAFFVLEMFVGLQVGPSRFQKGLLVQEFELGEFTRLAMALITFVLVNCWGLGRKSWN